MTALVTRHLPLVAGAPDGVNKLRSLVRELAVRGRLTQQNPADEHADVLLNRIFNKRRALAESVRQKAVRNFAEVLPTDRPFPIPVGWAFDRLGAVAALITKGTTPTTLGFAYATSGIRFVKVEDVQSGRVQGSYGATYISTDANEALARSKLAEGDVLFSIAGTIGKTCLIYKADLPANTNQAFAIIRGAGEIFDLHFLRLQLDSFVAEKTRRRARGGAMPNVSLGDLSDLIVVVPPLAEQHRIVAKVDELMALCDRLEADQSDAEAAHAQLVQALLDSLTQATDAADFRASWQRLSEHFHTLFTTEASIDALRKAILHLAADGRLVTSDGSVDVKAIGDVLEGNTLNGCSYKPTEEPRGTPILRISAGTGRDDFYVDESDHKWIELSELERAKFCLQPDDLLACRFNGNLHYVGSFSLYRGLSTVAQAFPDKLIRFRANRQLALPSYLRLVMNAKPAREQIESFCATTVGNIGISASNLKTIKIRIPSLNEQRRIVAKVDELMALCDELKAHVSEARQHYEQLAQALVEQAIS
ncbi:restriction endonuclease subunit S [Aquabacterium sp.]|uniref:restriction endonuclease subunit S n=1 Tax=Aquabacterium sp. TaxID=1872578 RepID=UPI002E30D185|nr:restriction endonuclease subunit S [Aquabacterium sp.]HEX5311982.1 restriction endonuclease subunit S [Aquabacterium sp.]